MPEKPKVSVGPIREDGTMHVHIPKPDGTTLGLNLSAKPSSESDLLARLNALKHKNRAATEVRQNVIAQRKRRFNFERGLWRLYLCGAAIWGIAILGMLVLSLISTQNIHRDAFDSLLAAAITLPTLLCAYFVLKTTIRYVLWPPLKWIVDGFTQK
jgi:hypothetical protein